MVEFKEKRVWFKANGKRVCGVLTVPLEKGKFPIVVLSHGFMSHKNSNTNLSMTKLLNNKNIAIFRFDYYGRSESQGRLGDITVTKDFKCLRAAVSFVKKQNFVDKQRICLLGSSLGGLMSILGMSRIKGIICGVLFAPVSNWKESIKDGWYKGYSVEEWKKKGFIPRSAGKLRRKVNLKYSFYKDARRYNGFKEAENINCPVLVIHGTEDESVFLSYSKKLIKHLKGKKKLTVLNGADHNFYPEKCRKIRHKLALDWILKYL